MDRNLHNAALPVLALLVALAVTSTSFAQDAMAPAADAMAPHAAMAPAADTKISDDDLVVCLEQAATLTFPEVAYAATMACQKLHQTAMATDASGSTNDDSNAMAPGMMAQDAMAPVTK